MGIDPNASSCSGSRVLTSRTCVLTRPVYDLNDRVPLPERYLIDIHAHAEDAAQVSRLRPGTVSRS